jgi:hypothetical protein
MTWQDRIS